MQEKISFLGKFHFTWKKVLFSLVLLYIAALVIPYIPHKKVKEDFKHSFKAMNFYSPIAGTERIAYINDNTDALKYRLRMIEEAQKEIILSTFDFNDDRAGRELLSSLIHAADRGVSVRLIIDGTSGFLDVRTSPWFQAAASHKNLEIRIYNPINFLKPWKMQARLHDKYMIVDEKMFLLGGRNSNNLFLGDYTSAQNVDRELFVYETTKDEHSSLYQLRSYFENIWALKDSKNFSCRKMTDKVKSCDVKLKKQYDKLAEQYPSTRKEWDWEALTLETNKVSLLSNPINTGNKEPQMWYSIHQLLMTGKQATIYTPYIICGKEMYDDLTTLKEKDISVEIITNDVAKGANPWGCTDYLNQKKNIWATGAKVYEYMAPHSCHTKAVMIDDRMTILGSYNLDMRSTYQDTELMLAMDCPELNALIRKEAEHDKTCSKVMENGTYQYGENYKKKKLSVGKKTFYSILRILVIPIRRFL